MAADAQYLGDEFDRCIERFESSWRTGKFPSIDDYLAGKFGRGLGAAQRLELAKELVMIDLEYRWRRAGRRAAVTRDATAHVDGSRAEFPELPRLEDYLARYPELGSPLQLSTELIASEYRSRHRWGDEPTHQEYLERFPFREPAVREALARVDVRLPQSSAGRGLRVRCPHCQVTVVLGDHGLEGQLICPECARQFSLVDEARDHGGLNAADRVGTFELVERLGSGSFGTVWKARDLELDRLVAVKLPHRGLLDATQREQILREARTVAQLNHPNIVPVHEVGRAEDRLFIVTDLVAGQILSEWFEQRPTTPREAARLCMRIADALEHAHQRGVIHRDLKPSNVVVDNSGQPHLTDFGLAKRAAADVTMTVEGKLLGTPAYMSPEQARGTPHETDRRSDIYALGVILFELLTGERPFSGSTEVLLQRIVSEDAPSPRRLSSRVPRDLETICLKCLEKDPAGRYQTAGQLRDDLRRFTQGEPVHARPITKADRLWRRCKRSPIAAALGVIAGSLVLILAVAGPLVAFRQARLAAQEAEAREEIRRQLYISDMNVAVQAWEEGDMRRVRELLDRHQAHENQQDLRRFEWYYLWRLYQRSENLPTLPHGFPLTQVAFSSDGRTLATASGQRGDRFEIKLWDARSGDALGSQRLDEPDICAGAFSRDVQTIALGYREGTIRLKSTSRKTVTIVLKGHADPILSLAFSPDGAKLASRSREKVVLWDLSAHEIDWELPTNEGPLNAPPVWFSPMAFSCDGQMLAWGTTDGTIKLCDAATGAEPVTLEQYRGTITSIAFSPDGQFLASTSGKSNAVVLWDVRSRTFLQELKGQKGFMLSVAFSADGRMLASAGQDNTVRLWDVLARKQLKVLQGHTGGVTTVAFSPSDGTLASGGEGGTVRLWNGDHYREEDLLEGHGDSVWDTAFSPDSRMLASASLDKKIQLWDVVTGTIQRTLPENAERVWCVAYCPYGKTLASGSGVLDSGSRPGRLKLWDAATGESLRESSLATAAIRSVAFAADGKRIAVGTAGGKVLVLDAVTLDLLTATGQHADSVYCVAFSPDGKILASAGQDKLVKLWHLESGRHHDLRGHRGLVLSVAFSPDGKVLASGSRDRTVKLWGVPDGRNLTTLTGHTAWVTCVAFSRDGQTLVSGDGMGAIKLWNVATQQRRVNLPRQTATVFSAGFSPNGQILATSAGDKIRLWRAAPYRVKRPDGQ